MKYYGDYLVGKQSDWQAFATEFGLVIADLMAVARQSTLKVQPADEWLWLVELWDTDFHQIVRAWKHGILPMKQWQASQMGSPIANIKGKDGLPIIAGGNIIADREAALLQWAYLLEPTMPDDLTPAQIITFITANNTKEKLIALFDAFEYEEII